jgi:hypothetical protein
MTEAQMRIEPRGFRHLLEATQAKLPILEVYDAMPSMYILAQGQDCGEMLQPPGGITADA